MLPRYRNISDPHLTVMTSAQTQIAHVLKVDNMYDFDPLLLKNLFCIDALEEDEVRVSGEFHTQ